MRKEQSAVAIYTNKIMEIYINAIKGNEDNPAKLIYVNSVIKQLLSPVSDVTPRPRKRSIR